MSLPLLPIEDGFNALRRGIIHDHPVGDWIGALEHMDTTIKQAPAQIRSMVMDCAIHKRFDALLLIANWSQNQVTALRNSMGRALLSTWVRNELPSEVSQWMLDHCFKSDPLALWNAYCYGTSNPLGVSVKEPVRLKIMETDASFVNFQWLVDQTSKQPDKMRKLPWDELLDYSHERMDRLSPQAHEYLVRSAPSGLEAHFKKAVEDHEAVLLKGYGLRSPWSMTRELLKRLGDGADLANREGAWTSIFRDVRRNQGEKCMALGPLLVYQVYASGNEDKMEKMISLAKSTWVLDEVDIWLEEAALRHSTAAAPKTARQSLRL